MCLTLSVFRCAKHLPGPAKENRPIGAAFFFSG